VRGPAYFAAFGLFAVIEWTVINAPYEHVVVPAMDAVEALRRMYFDVLKQVGWESFGAMATFQSLVTEITMATDPRSALEAVREDADGPGRGARGAGRGGRIVVQLGHNRRAKTCPKPCPQLGRYDPRERAPTGPNSAQPSRIERLGANS